MTGSSAGQTQPALGILVCERSGNPPFAEASFIRKLCEAGKDIGLPVVAFSPLSWQMQDNTVLGWRWEKRTQKWLRQHMKLPQVLYDRAWPADEHVHMQYRQTRQLLVATARPILMNGRLPDKLRVHQYLTRFDALRSILPPTARYSTEAAFIQWLERHEQQAFLKPAAGCQGRRAAACRALPDGSVSISGRTGANRPFVRHYRNRSIAAAAIHRWIGTRAYVMQPLLELRNIDDEPFDVRVLLQKDGQGRWQLTGAAARCGDARSITANLHGGGRAMLLGDVLRPMLGEARVQALEHKLLHRSRLILQALETGFGRFSELGLDYGIERSGRLWFLEANAKPGRAAMAHISENAAQLAISTPVAYAKFILERSSGRVIHEFDNL